MTSIESLKTKIIEAFSDVQPPKPEHLVEHNCPECRAIRRVFKNEIWQDISPEKIEWAFDKLPLLSAEGHRYFLPAFLLHCINESSVDVCMFVLFDLTNVSEDKSQLEWQRKRFDIFTKTQKDACSSFLKWIQTDLESKGLNSEDNHLIERALEKRWKN